jgi:hypothetical protein
MNIRWALALLLVFSFAAGAQVFRGRGQAPSIVGNCGMQLGGTAIFCEPFDAPYTGPIQSRSGALDPNVWGVSRTIANVNSGQGFFNGWPATLQDTCTGTATVNAPNDIIICNGQLREAVNDNPVNLFDGGTVTILPMYPKQPFDWAGRTGTVAFDVSNDTNGGHAAWPEFWISNLPVPAPFNHFDSWIALPQHGFGIRFSGYAIANTIGICPTTANITVDRWTIDTSVVVRNYIYEDVTFAGLEFGTASTPPLILTVFDCVISPVRGSGVTNHVEIRVSQSEIDIYAADAGVPSSLRKIAALTNANLSFTRGLVWLDDVHYNADKATLSEPPGTPSQREHTFVWDNLAFDGPFTYRDFSFDALDGTMVNSEGSVNLGQFSDPGTSSSWNVLGLPASPNPEFVRVLFNFIPDNVNPTVLNLTVNGNPHTVAWPYPDSTPSSFRTLAVTIPVTELVTGTNVVTIGSDVFMTTTNVNIVLVNVPGGVPVLPGNSRTYPP